MATEDKVLHVTRHVTWVGFWVNAFLAVAKIVSGIIGRSSAMVADGVHSLSDFLTDIIVIVFVSISRKKADEHYQYGHGKYETFGVMLISMLLAVVGVMFFIEGAGKCLDALHGEELERPGMLALVMAVVSIAAKEWLFHYTIGWGRKVESNALIANAWHHRSDAFSSGATLAGIAGAMFLGVQWRVLDPLAAMVVSVIIVVVSFKIGLPAVRELLEVSLPRAEQEEIASIVKSAPGVKGFHRLRTRRNGSAKIVDVHVKVDPDIPVSAGHDIATDVEHRLKERFGDATMVNVHVEPWSGSV